LRAKNDLPLDKRIRTSASRLTTARPSAEYLLTFGVHTGPEMISYIKLMKDAAAYARDSGLKLVLKPHGGESGGAEEIIPP
jgi:hypothetical protein